MTEKFSKKWMLVRLFGVLIALFMCASCSSPFGSRRAGEVRSRIVTGLDNRAVFGAVVDSQRGPFSSADEALFYCVCYACDRTSSVRAAIGGQERAELGGVEMRQGAMALIDESRWGCASDRDGGGVFGMEQFLESARASGRYCMWVSVDVRWDNPNANAVVAVNFTSSGFDSSSCFFELSGYEGGQWGVRFRGAQSI